MKIKTIKEENYDGFVYDIQVQNNHNYFAESILIHNCYMSSTSEEDNYTNVVEKTRNFFLPMTENERPFQVAIGGGEPTEHPEFVEVLRVLKQEFDICPNYTTNGMWIYSDRKDDIIEATAWYCGGVAISCHPHLEKYWSRAAARLAEESVKLNFHIIISDRESINYFRDIYDQWKDKIDYFVLLPYGNQGRAEHKDIDWEYLITRIPDDQTKIAFGANFYPYLLKGQHNIRVSLYQPEIFSKFLDLKDMKIYPSSFNLIECKSNE